MLSRYFAVFFATITLASSAFAATQPVESNKTPANKGERQLTPFQDGVEIDWEEKKVYVDTHVVFRQGPLEFVACLPGKEHESIVCCDALGLHIFMAMGLVGLTPGTPPHWNADRQMYEAPTGDLVDIVFEWKVDGEAHEANAFDWMRELHTGRRPVTRPWIFGGSHLRKNGTLAADDEGECVAVVDKTKALISYTRRFPSKLDSLWVGVKTKAVPPLDTPITMVISAAKQRDYDIILDELGNFWINGRLVGVEEAADIMITAMKLTGNKVVQIKDHSLLHTDRATWKRRLSQFGIPTDAIRFTPTATQPNKLNIGSTMPGAESSRRQNASSSEDSAAP